MDTWELEHPSVWLFKQEVSRKHSNLIRGTKDGTGKAGSDSRPDLPAGKQPTVPEMRTSRFQSGRVSLGRVSFFKKPLESSVLIHTVETEKVTWKLHLWGVHGW